jgi:hypothetical protein
MAYFRAPDIQRLRKIGEIFRISWPSGLESNPVPQEQRHEYVVRERTKEVRNNNSGYDLHSSSTQFESRNEHLRCQAFKASFVGVYLNRPLWVPLRSFQVLGAWLLSLRVLCWVAFATCSFMKCTKQQKQNMHACNVHVLMFCSRRSVHLRVAAK